MILEPPKPPKFQETLGDLKEMLDELPCDPSTPLVIVAPIVPTDDDDDETNVVSIESVVYRYGSVYIRLK